jgi:hypothetical protein
MGGTSEVLTGNTKEEILKKAKLWYERADELGLYPRDNFVYGRADIPVTYHSSIENCQNTAHVILIDTKRTELPNDADFEIPFSVFTKKLSQKDKKKRFYCFVSAHT